MGESSAVFLDWDRHVRVYRDGNFPREWDPTSVCGLRKRSVDQLSEIIFRKGERIVFRAHCDL